MQARLIQSSHMAPGTAELHCLGSSLAAETAEFCLGQPLPGGGYSHLDPRDSQSPWGAAEFWIRPDGVRRQDGALVLPLDPAVTWHLAPNKPYLLFLRDGAGGAEKSPVLGIPLRLPSTPPARWKPAEVAAVAAPPPPPPPPPAVEPEPPAPDLPPLVAEREPEPAPPPAPPAASAGMKRGSAVMVILGVAAAWILLGAGAYWWFVLRDAADPSVPAAPPVAASPAEKHDLATARALLATSPAAEAARTRAEAHVAAKDLEGAFLLYRAAAEKGDAKASVALGGFYDPASWTKETSPLPAPNADQALGWYRRAAEAGDAEAQYRLGLLLKSGKTEVADGPEQAVGWLKKAADQGHPKAKEALAP